MLRHVKPPPGGRSGIACSTDSSTVSNDTASSSTPLTSEPLPSLCSARAPTDITSSVRQDIQDSYKRPAELHKTKEVRTDPIPELEKAAKPEDPRPYFPQQSMGAFLMQANLNGTLSAAGNVPPPPVPPGTASFENGWYQAAPVQGHPPILLAGYGSRHQNPIQFSERRPQMASQHVATSREPYQPPPRLYIPRRDNNENPSTNSQNKILGARSMNQNPISQSTNGCTPSSITMHAPQIAPRGTRINRGFIPGYAFDQNVHAGWTFPGGTMQPVGSYNANHLSIGTDALPLSTSISDHRGS